MRRDIKRELEDRGISIAKWQHGEHRCPCPECKRGKKDTALAVRIDHDGATWICHRCEFKGGIGPEREQLSRRRDTPRRDLRPEPEPDEPEHNPLSKWGLDLWEQCSSILPGTPAANYLDRRCCLIPPGDLRWHPELKHPATGTKWPALVALVTDALDGEPISLHRTWLAKNGNGKAPIEPNRLLLKGHRYKGGVIRLWPDSAVTMGLVLGEGVETCLSAALEGLTPVWASISARNLANFPVLPIEGLTILIDHDKPNPKTGKRAGIDAAKALSQHYVAAGFNPHRDIHVFEPDTEGEDANDVVRRRRGLDR